jgi:hypothetical protein
MERVESARTDGMGGASPNLLQSMGSTARRSAAGSGAERRGGGEDGCGCAERDIEEAEGRKRVQ